MVWRLDRYIRGLGTGTRAVSFCNELITLFPLHITLWLQIDVNISVSDLRKEINVKTSHLRFYGLS